MLFSKKLADAKVPSPPTWGQPFGLNFTPISYLFPAT